jgi:hypothetical protein
MMPRSIIRSALALAPATISRGTPRSAWGMPLTYHGPRPTLCPRPAPAIALTLGWTWTSSRAVGDCGPGPRFYPQVSPLCQGRRLPAVMDPGPCPRLAPVRCLALGDARTGPKGRAERGRTAGRGHYTITPLRSFIIFIFLKYLIIVFISLVVPYNIFIFLQFLHDLRAGQA